MHDLGRSITLPAGSPTGALISGVSPQRGDGMSPFPESLGGRAARWFAALPHSKRVTSSNPWGSVFSPPCLRWSPVHPVLRFPPRPRVLRVGLLLLLVPAGALEQGTRQQSWSQSPQPASELPNAASDVSMP